VVFALSTITRSISNEAIQNYIDIENNKTSILQALSWLHYGTLFEEIGKALRCISSLSMALFGISGIMIFCRKKAKRERKKKR
jgi:hypothetical protein